MHPTPMNALKEEKKKKRKGKEGLTYWGCTK